MDLFVEIGLTNPAAAGLPRHPRAADQKLHFLPPQTAFAESQLKA